jgi:hypothetical protein
MDPTDLSNQIDRILRSQTFARKSQLRKLLEVLFQYMDSQARLNADLVISKLWPEETRTKRSADVAAEMNRLRHALESYYDREGHADPITISLPNRSVTAVVDGTQEKCWIVAKPRGGVEDHPQAKLSRGVKIMGATATLGAALGIVAFIFIRFLAVHDQPKVGRLDGSMLAIMNAEGKELWRKTFPEGFGPEWYYAQATTTRMWFGDLEGKGHTSVLFVYAPAASPVSSHSSTLICYSDRGQEKWRWTPGRELPELAGSPATYKTFAFGVLKATEKTPPRIVVSSAHDTWWPNQIAILDSDGKLISEYWHSGRLDDMVLADLDGDGSEEIVATGVSNGYDHQATLVVLDPNRVFGASTEVRPDFQIHGLGFAQERLRLLFPRSDLNRALFAYNRAQGPIVQQGSIRLTVQECTTPPGCLIWYEFDKNLHLISAYAGEEFSSAHARFYQNSKDAHALSVEEQNAFHKIRCLVGCKSEFVPIGHLLP